MKILTFFFCLAIGNLQAQQDCFPDWTFEDNNLIINSEEELPKLICIELDSINEAELAATLREVWKRKDKEPFFKLNEEFFSGYLDGKLPNGNFIFQGSFSEGVLLNYGYFVLPKIPEASSPQTSKSKPNSYQAPQSNPSSNSRYLPLRERYVKPNFRQ